MANPAFFFDRLLQFLFGDVPQDNLAIIAAGDERFAVGRRGEDGLDDVGL